MFVEGHVGDGMPIFLTICRYFGCVTDMEEKFDTSLLEFYRDKRYDERKR